MNEDVQHAWDAAYADMDVRERRVADAWRTALDAARAGTETLRSIWPSHTSELDASGAEGVSSALADLERAWATLERLDDSMVGSDFAEARTR